MPVQAERRLWYKLPLVSQAKRRSSLEIQSLVIKILGRCTLESVDKSGILHLNGSFQVLRIFIHHFYYSFLRCFQIDPAEQGDSGTGKGRACFTTKRTHLVNMTAYVLHVSDFIDRI